MTHRLQRLQAVGIVSAVALIAMIITAALVLGPRTMANSQGHMNEPMPRDSAKKLPAIDSSMACPTPVMARIVAATPGAAGAALASILATTTSLGSTTAVRFVQATNLATAEAGVPVEEGGQYGGHGSCDFTLSDNPAAAKLADAGAVALAAKGLPVDKSGTRVPGEQRYLLRSTAFQSNLAYVLYIVPDPASAQPNSFGGQTYTRNLYAIAVIAPDGSVRYAGSLAQR